MAINPTKTPPEGQAKVGSAGPEISAPTRAGEPGLSYSPGAQIDRLDPGDAKVGTIRTGWASEQRITLGGQRQIFGFLIPGDLIAISSLSDLAGRAVIALTPVVLARNVFSAGPNAALSAIAAIREVRLLDQITRLGSLDAYERTAHQLLELHDRLMVVDLVKESSFGLPVTQEAFGEALGLSIVHMNRTLQRLKQDGLIAFGRGRLTLLKPEALRKISGAGSQPFKAVQRRSRRSHA